MSSRPLTQIFKNEKGAIDLASIMVGIIVIGLVGGVIAGTVFAVIPWAQDNAAKQQLESVEAAQSAYMGLTSAVPMAVQGPADMHIANTYGDSAQLSAAGLLLESPDYCVITTGEGKGYQSFSKSSSGQVFTITNQSTGRVPVVGITDSYVSSLPSNCEPVFANATRDFDTDNFVMTYYSPTNAVVELPIRGGSGQVVWSDEPDSPKTYGSSDVISKALTAGQTYTATIKGTFPTVDYRDRKGAEALTDITHWGDKTGTTDASYAFYDASNLVEVPASIPSTITNMTKMFSGAEKLNDKDVEGWNVSNARHLSHMFEGTATDANLGAWNLSNAVNAAFILDDKWSLPLNAYKALDKTTTLTYRCDTTKTIELPIRNTTSDATVTWNDGQIDVVPAGSYNQPSAGTVVPTYSKEVIKDRTYTVVVEGTYRVFSYGSISSNHPLSLTGNDCLLSLDHWGESTGVTTANRGFYGVTTAFTVPSQIPSTVTNTRSMFSNAPSFNDDISGWNTSKITDMAWMFSVARVFNQDISKWDTRSLENMQYMFSYANSFNQDIGDWDVSKVTTMDRTFMSAFAFNQDISSWNVSAVEEMGAMFQSATAFSQDLSSWDISKVRVSGDFRIHSGLSAAQSPFKV